MDAFINYLFFKTNPEYPTIVSSHFGGRYDNILAAREIYKMTAAIKTNFIARGNKILNMVNKGIAGRKDKITKTDFHDSFNILPMALSSLPKTFDLEKGVFPYTYNQPEKYSLELERLPGIEFYDVPNIKSKQYQHFQEWYVLENFQQIFRYENNRSLKFWLPKELDEYCTIDTKILALSLIKYRDNIKEVYEGIDILK